MCLLEAYIYVLSICLCRAVAEELRRCKDEDCQTDHVICNVSALEWSVMRKL